MTQIQISFAGRTEVYDSSQVVTVGRSLDATFQINDPSISRIHFRLAFDESARNWVLTDSNSANGCWVNNIQVDSARVTVPMDVHLGKEVLSAVVTLTPTTAAAKVAPTGSTLSAKDLIIGKAADADFILSDVLVSRKHARLIRFEQSLVLEDLGSTNGTYLNGKLVRTAPVREGDVITIGNNDLTIRNGELDYLRSQSEKTGGLYVNDL